MASDNEKVPQEPSLTKEQVLQQLNAMNRRIAQFERDNVDLATLLRTAQEGLEGRGKGPATAGPSGEIRPVPLVPTKEPGKMLKPPKPEPFDGISTKLQLFLT
ncbi:hypothetical protein DL767_006945 [Monosporascus sp. MG133]|nr:hypothetical protein DL767_006945 [Monosporascus sp. MG133]